MSISDAEKIVVVTASDWPQWLTDKQNAQIVEHMLRQHPRGPYDYE